MDLQLGNVKISVCNDHRNYADEEITFGDAIRADELLKRISQIAQSIKGKNSGKKISTKNKVDADLTEAVKRLLE